MHSAHTNSKHFSQIVHKEETAAAGIAAAALLNYLAEISVLDSYLRYLF
jgi:hypothetical protein